MDNGCNDLVWYSISRLSKVNRLFYCLKYCKLWAIYSHIATYIHMYVFILFSIRKCMFYVFTLEQSTFNGLLNGAIKCDGNQTNDINFMANLYIHTSISLFVLYFRLFRRRLSQTGALRLREREKQNKNRVNTLCILAFTSDTLCFKIEANFMIIVE